MDQIKKFSFHGDISPSKSLMNRALVVQSFFPDLNVEGHSECDDVVHLRNAFFNFQELGAQQFDVGDGGTTFRFLMARLSREQGEFEITGSERLMTRPHAPLLAALKNLGCQVVDRGGEGYFIQSRGWTVPDQLNMSLEVSSQFVSAILLSAWQLPKPLTIKLDHFNHSQSYLEMTISFLRKFGMEIHFADNVIQVPPEQKCHVDRIKLEPDMSSCFTLACFAAFAGELSLPNFPKQSLQPDASFVEILREVGASVDFSSGLIVKSTGKLKAIDLNLKNNPDLFPVLAVLLSRAQGVSHLSGLENLVYKESNRLQKILDLLGDLGIDCSRQNKKVLIEGRPNHTYPRSFEFDTDKDHRLAMAAALACHQGASLKILNPQVVNKSFPEFWQVVGQ